MIRALPLALVACSAAPTLPPPYAWGAEYGPGPWHARPGIVCAIETPVDGTLDAIGLFSLAHEAAHCQHVVDELSADCWAIQWMARADYLTPTVLATIVAEVQLWPSSPRHPPGAARAVRIMECAP